MLNEIRTIIANIFYTLADKISPKIADEYQEIILIARQVDENDYSALTHDLQITAVENTSGIMKPPIKAPTTMDSRIYNDIVSGIKNLIEKDGITTIEFKNGDTIIAPKRKLVEIINRDKNGTPCGYCDGKNKNCQICEGTGFILSYKN